MDVPYISPVYVGTRRFWKYYEIIPLTFKPDPITNHKQHKIVRIEENILAKNVYKVTGTKNTYHFLNQ